MMIAPLYASCHEQAGQRSDEKASVDGEEKVPGNGPEPEK
ncbi:hypothetical protein HMPREF1204_04478 [Bacteroides fragilis HMW 615]|nr:hypothetical protein HMPREF1204_04478 [Bacteroides fragilis HMW 615]